MPTVASTAAPRGLARALGWRRLRVAIGSAALLGLITSPAFTEVATVEVIARTTSVGLASLLAFALFERWPPRLPRWLARWVLQVFGVALVIPFAALAVTLVVTHADTMPLWNNKDRLSGMAMLIVIGLLFAPWITVAALFRQRDFAARSQALAFELERSELERQALDSWLRLLQAQVEPHFLFNTLANVRELVDSGSPQASQVLGHLIAYLRAAVPRLHEPATTLAQELQLVRAYLELMHMRMPDRLQFSMQVDQQALDLQCPPMTLLTLVENAVRHGIDPSEEGGHIEVRVQRRGGRCHAEVSDTGVGLRTSGNGLGTGLSTLSERLQLVFTGDARLQLASLAPHGVRVELDFPARQGST